MLNARIRTRQAERRTATGMPHAETTTDPHSGSDRPNIAAGEFYFINELDR